MSFTGNDVEGLELPNLWRTSLPEDSNFDISADQLNNSVPRTMFLSGATVDWKSRRLINLTDPTGDQDAATKAYVDLSGGALWSTFDAIQNVDMAGFLINNLGTPLADADAATKLYVDNNSGSTTLIGLTDVNYPVNNPPLDGQFLIFNTSTSQWENQTFSPGSPTSIVSLDGQTSVTTQNGGPIDNNVDGSLAFRLTTTLVEVKKPLDMGLFKIQNLFGPPTANTDAANKIYVDDSITSGIASASLDDLSDVTFDTTPQTNQVMVNDGLVWRNQALAKAQLPTAIAYEDEANTFEQLVTFELGILGTVNQETNLAGGFLSNIREATFNLQGSDPSNPTLSDSTLFYGSGTYMDTTDPLWSVLVDRGGAIIKKPVVTSETVYALRRFSNGMFTQETGTDTVAGDTATTVKVRMFNENQPGQAFEVVLDGQQHTIPDGVANPGTDNTIDLTQGTDLTPATHWVWIQLDVPNTGVPVMTSNTTGFPSGIDFAVVGKFFIQSRATFDTDGAVWAALSPDYEIFDEVSRGHLAHINDRLNELDAAYLEGIDFTMTPTPTNSTTGAVTWATAVGKSFELHPEDIEAFDSAVANAISYIVNEGTQSAGQVTRVTNLSTDLIGLTLANGTTTLWQNNQFVNLVLFAIHNDTEPNQTNYGVNLPVDAYTNLADAQADASSFAVKDIPITMRGLSLLVFEVIVSFATAGATYTVESTSDLRGRIPGAAGGGGSGGGGATDLDGLTDVTIGGGPPGVALTVGQILRFEADSQWRNIDNPFGELAQINIWTNYQQYTPLAVGTGPTGVDGQFFTEVIDISNTGLFVNLNQAGVIQKVRLA